MTVADLTMTRASAQPDHNCRRATQKARSAGRMRGRRRGAKVASCWRRARFSSRRSRWERKAETNTRIDIATSRSMEKRGSRARSETSMNPAGTRFWRTTTCGTLTLVVARGNRRTFQQGQLQDGLDHAAFDEDPPCATCCTPLPQRQKHHELT